MGIGIDNRFFMQDYRINDIPKVDIPKVDSTQNAPLQTDSKPQNTGASVSIEPLEDRRPRSVDPGEVSLSFNRQEDFGYIGRDKDLSLLDMEKAISMMRQDSILQDYQYFVGDNRELFSSEDGRVIAK